MPQYSYECVRCLAKYTRIISSWSERDNQRCDKMVPVGVAPAYRQAADGQLSFDHVSFVPPGQQPDPNATGQIRCHGILYRQKELEEQTAATPYAWKP